MFSLRCERGYKIVQVLVLHTLMVDNLTGSVGDVGEYATLSSESKMERGGVSLCALSLPSG